MRTGNHPQANRLQGSGIVGVGLVADGGIDLRAARLARTFALSLHQAADRCHPGQDVSAGHQGATPKLAGHLSRTAKNVRRSGGAPVRGNPSLLSSVSMPVLALRRSPLHRGPGPGHSAAHPGGRQQRQHRNAARSAGPIPQVFLAVISKEEGVCVVSQRLYSCVEHIALSMCSGQMKQEKTATATNNKH